MKQANRSRSVDARTRGMRVVFFALLAVGGTGCGTADDGKLPPDIPDPTTLKTPAGAMARYKSAVSYAGGAVDRMITASGIMTDELAMLRAPITAGANLYTAADARVSFGELSRIDFKHMNQMRSQAREGRGFLAAYAPDSSPALRGHLTALEGYADIYLADLFCSGIPLSTVNFDGSYTLAPGSTTTEVYQQAVTLFDSAAALFALKPTDSLALQHLAAVGKGRALLALGEFADAAAAVAGVPDDYVMPVTVHFDVKATVGDDQVLRYGLSESAALWSFLANYEGGGVGVPGVADREGLTGLDYRTSGDPRTATVAFGSANSDSLYLPAKYTFVSGVYNATDTFQMATGIEARLIEAEAALQGGGDWLGILNHLRQTAWTTIKPAIAGPLPDLADPGSPAARVDLLFRERAFWLFMTGHRQGDLRRLLRQHPERSVNQVYPTGSYPGGGGISTYGDSIVIAPPTDERLLNPKYSGCIHGNP